MLGGTCDNTCCNGGKFGGGNGAGRGGCNGGTSGIIGSSCSSSRGGGARSTGGGRAGGRMYFGTGETGRAFDLPCTVDTNPPVHVGGVSTLKQTRVGQLMVVAEVACLVEPSMVADSGCSPYRRIVGNVQDGKRREVPRSHVSKHLAARTNVEVVLCMVAARSHEYLEVVLCMVVLYPYVALVTGPDIVPNRFQVGAR